MKPPVVVIPGIPGSVLQDHYPLSPETVWDLVGARDYERVALHPDDLRYEERQPARIRATEAFAIPYRQIVRELRHDLTADPERPRPVHLFPYDWRQPLRRLVDELEHFLGEVADRTALLRPYHQVGYPRRPEVDLVGHSMGGLLAAGLLARRSRGEARVRIRRVVSLGTPFGGSFEAVIKIITGTAALGGGVPSSRERETARLTPALYHLLPRYSGAVLRNDGALPDTLFDAGLWQRGVVASISEHLRRKGVDPPRDDVARTRAARELLQGMLDEAAAFRDEVDALDLEEAGLHTRDWLAIAGVGERTRLRLLVEGPAHDPYFNLRSMDREDRYRDEEPPSATDAGDAPERPSPTRTGDGTVPFPASIPPFLPSATMVVVSPEDLGYWEMGDRVLGHMAGLHALLPAMNRVIKLTGTFLDGAAGKRAPVFRGLHARRPPAVASEAWNPPLQLT